MADSSSQQPSLTVLGGPMAGQRLVLDESVANLLIGSDPSCDFYLPHDSVSPIHARLWVDLDGAGLVVGARALRPPTLLSSRSASGKDGPGGPPRRDGMGELDGKVAVITGGCSGIGLATVRRVIEAHAGRIGLTETPGGGTTVWFDLPD